MDLEKQYFPLAFEEIRKLMAHGATTHRDDQEWREHSIDEHLFHADAHSGEWEIGEKIDPDSKQTQLAHVACRAMMALEVELGGGVVK